MDVDIKINATKNVFEDNESIVLKREDVPDHLRLFPNIGAVNFLTTRVGFQCTVEDLVVHCGWECLEEFGRFSGHPYRVWCFISDAFWQIPTRVTRYKKLRRYHKAFLQTPGIGEIGPEVEFQSEKEIRFAGVVEVAGEALIQALKLVRLNPSCAIILSCRQDFPSEDQVRALFDQAFYDKKGRRETKVNFAALSAFACIHGDAVLRVWGFFDDIEASAHLIAKQDITDEFARYLEKHRS